MHVDAKEGLRETKIITIVRDSVVND